MAESFFEFSGMEIESADAVALMRRWEVLDSRMSPAQIGMLATREAFNDNFEQRLYG